MNKKQTYTVAKHSFCLILEESDPLWTQLAHSFGPFEEKEENKHPLFTVTVYSEPSNTEQSSNHQQSARESANESTVSESVSFNELTRESAKEIDQFPSIDQAEPIFMDPNSNPMEGKINVYRTDNSHLFELIPGSGRKQQSLLYLSDDLQTGELLLHGSNYDRFYGVNTSLMLCFMLATAGLNTVLMHASAVVHDNKSYLFLGRSGTGKSTHSNLWLQYISNSELLNDDHPIVRFHPFEGAIAYGSPWSGKTPCYRNTSAPVGGIVRIKQAPYNQIKLLPLVQAYASLTTSCSGMSWDKTLADGKSRTLQEIINSVPCYTLECQPKKEAAILCSQTIKKD